MLGKKIKLLRETKGLLQRHVAAVLEVDIAYVSKMENNEKPVSKAYLPKLAALLGASEKELYTLWLADRVYDVVKDEDDALKAMEAAEEEIRIHNRRRK